MKPKGRFIPALALRARRAGGTPALLLKRQKVLRGLRKLRATLSVSAFFILPFALASFPALGDGTGKLQVIAWAGSLLAFEVSEYDRILSCVGSLSF